VLQLEAMRCPKCSKKTRVVECRRNKAGIKFYRRRWCLNAKCEYRFSTQETVVTKIGKLSVADISNEVAELKADVYDLERSVYKI
jgi:transcriptional regulator NrdR family protein